MIEFRIPYGHTSLSLLLPEELRVDIIAPVEIPAAPNPSQLVQQALASPLGSKRIQDLKNINSATIVINDKTRPVPHKHLLPPLLEQIAKLGLQPNQISLLIATGAHPPMLPEEFPKIIPSNIIGRYPVYSHDIEDEANLVFCGETSRRTPVWINRRFMQADLRIVVGNIEPHQFQGYSGGVKSAAIGLAGKTTITHNHAMMKDAKARLGIYADNPARQDIEEIGKLIGVHFALNAILNEHKQIVHVVSGEPQAVMQSGILLAQQVFQVFVDDLYDLVIASPGGHPKDINIYQSQKGLAHACLVTRPGGTVILTAACPEGSGSQSFESWMRSMESFEQVFDRFQKEGFRIGPHKAYLFARDAHYARVLLLSTLQPDFVRSLLLEPIEDLQTTIDSILEELPTDARVGIMPRATLTIPTSRK